MADPLLALANIGKSHRTRTGPPRAIKAIRQDVIKVNFDPDRAAAELVRLVPRARATASQVVFTPTVSAVDVKALEAESNREMRIIKDPMRSLFRSRSTPSRYSNLSLAASRKSSLLMSVSEKSSFDLIGETPNNDIHFQSKGSRTNRRKQEFPPHGFRYHSNGDERVSKPLSARSSCASSASFRVEEAASSLSQLISFRDRVVRSLPSLHTKRADKLGIHYSVGDLEKRLQEEKAPPGVFRALARVRSEPITESQDARISKFARAATAKGNDNMFRRTILRHINDMAQSGESVSRASLTRVTSTLSNARGSSEGRTLGRLTSLLIPESQDHGTAQGNKSQGDCLSAGNSSFNMRYGVPVKLMAQRKHVLDEQYYKELVETQKNNDQIDSFLMELKSTTEAPKAQTGLTPLF